MTPMTPERAAGLVLARCWDLRVPVDVQSIAGCLRIDVAYEHGMEVSGEVSLQTGGRPRILVNAGDSLVRQRFTIAHEIGHVVLGHLDTAHTVYRDTRQNYTLGNFDPRERDANYFAAELLMPADAVRVYAAEEKGATIHTLAERFQVSATAMEIRLKTLGILPPWFSREVSSCVS